MGSMNAMPEPIRTGRLTGGGMLVAMKSIDFLDARHGHMKLLEPGVQFGVMLRFHWRYERMLWPDSFHSRSQRIRLRLGEHTGQIAELPVPSIGENGRIVPSPSSAPLLEASLWRDGGTITNIGQLAIGELEEGRKPILAGFDFGRLQDALPFPSCEEHGDLTHAEAHIDPHIGVIQTGSLYFMTSRADQDDLALRFM